jgi:hypothetical protein
MMPLSLAHLAPGTAAWVYGLTLALLVLHIGGGGIAILSGFAAFAVGKGGRLHRLFGLVFVVSMLTMAVAATILASRIPQRGNIGGGLLVCYLVASAWLTVRRKPGTIGRLEIALCAAAAAIAVTIFLLGLQAERSPTGTLDGFPAGPFFALAGLAALFALLDVPMILRGGVSGARRTARHLGRMGLALFFASGSFFIGQQKVMPASIHGSPILYGLGLAPLGMTLYWLVRLRLGGRRARRLAPA